MLQGLMLSVLGLGVSATVRSAQQARATSKVAVKCTVTEIVRNSRRLAMYLMLIAFIVLNANAAAAIVTDPQPLVPADQKTFEVVSSLLGDGEALTVDNLFVGWAGFTSDLFLVAQVRNDKCASDMCPTYIISYADDDKRIVLIAYLPARMTVGDVVKRMCLRCDQIYTLMFEDSSGAKYFFGVTKTYAVMFDRSLRDYRK